MYIFNIYILQKCYFRCRKTQSRCFGRGKSPCGHGGTHPLFLMHRKSLKVQFSVGRRPEWVRRRTGKLKVPGSIPGARRHRRDGPDSQKSGFCHTLKLTILRVLGTENAITALGWSRYGVILKNVYITTMCRSGLCGSRHLKLRYFARSKVFGKCWVGVEK